MINQKVRLCALLTAGAVLLSFQNSAQAASSDNSPRGTILTALLGAGTGAIAAEASGGKAGTGALVGAGTGVIGSALIDFFATPSTRQPVYSGYSAYQYPQPEPVYYSQPASYSSYSAPAAFSANDNSRNVIKNGLMGAATGAIASEVSDGKAGKGALIGAGTQVIGSALFDLFFPAQTAAQTVQPAYAYVPTTSHAYGQSHAKVFQKKIVRIYDSNGQLVSEEEYIV